MSGHLAVVKELLRARAAIDMLDAHSCSALMHATHGGMKDIYQVCRSYLFLLHETNGQ